MPHFYRIFDITLRSDLPLPELPPAALSQVSESDYAVSIEQGEGSPDQFDTQGFETVFEWRNDQGWLECWCERRGDEYFYSFSGSASFHIAPDSDPSQGVFLCVIRCFSHPGCSLQLQRHLLLNQIIPRYLASCGRLVLHAGALVLPNGQAVAFLGDSGFGKSTLVSSFYQHGAQLINDDCILLEYEQGELRVMGGLAGIRLFPDSVEALFDKENDFDLYTPYADKQQLFLVDQMSAEPTQSPALNAMFVLNDPLKNPANTVEISPVSGSAAMLAMIANTFSMDPSDTVAVARNFQNVGQAFAQNLVFYDLSYPRDHRCLAEVRATLTELLEDPAPA